jgi:hypothetical protein
MKEALNKWSRALVDAASAPTWEQYLCPLCYAPVSLRAGWARDPYFAHMPGTGHANCELYFASLSQTHGVTFSQHLLLGEAWEIAIGLQIGSTGYPRGWGIELSVPTGAMSEGEVHVDVGGRIQVLNLKGNRDPARRMTAEPQALPYRVISVNPSHSILSRQLKRACQALRVIGGTAFGEIIRPSAQLIPRAKRLHRGHSYAIVWNSEQIQQFPDELILEALHGRAPWAAAIITIPRYISEECKLWVEQFAGVPIVDATPLFVPVWPPLVRQVTSGCIEAMERTPLTFYIEGLACEKTLAPPAVFARSGREDLVIKGFPGSLPFFRITTFNEREVQLLCKDLKGLQSEINFGSDLSDLRTSVFTAVELIGTTKEGQRITICLHDESASPWLSQVRTGDIDLQFVTLPARCEGTLSTGLGGIWHQTTQFSGEPKAGHPNAHHVSDEVISKITLALCDHYSDVLLDFCGYGRAIVKASREAKKEINNALSTVLRDQLRTYLMQLPNRPAWPRISAASNDRNLIQAFAASRPTHKTLQTQNIIKSQLKKLGIDLISQG